MSAEPGNCREEEEELAVDDVDAPNIFPYKKCSDCGERKSCGNYNNDKEWFCEDCYEEEEFCEKHEQPMWKNGMKCGGCMDEEEKPASG